MLFRSQPASRNPKSVRLSATAVSSRVCQLCAKRVAFLAMDHSVAECERLVKASDVNFDGVLTRLEFCELCVDLLIGCVPRASPHTHAAPCRPPRSLASACRLRSLC